MRKKELTAKQVRKGDIGYMALVGTMVSNIVNGWSGVCGVHPYLDRRTGDLCYKPGVQLQAWKFMDVFGEDTEYEYLEDKDGDMEVITEVNGVTFYALLGCSDEIQKGRLV